MSRASGILISTVMLTGAIARAQPAPDVPIAPPPTPPGGQPAAGDPGAPPTTPPGPDGQPQQPPDFGDPYAPVKPVAEAPKRQLPPIFMPEVLTTPTGWLLPAGVIYSKTALDTGGGVSSDTRVGLGDVAEFGLASTDAVRERDGDDDARATRIQPYITASFRLGIAENRLFLGQPGFTLGFRKSFERNHDNFRTRIAELTLVASKHFGPNVAVHLGGAFWDASLEGDLDDDDVSARREITLHGQNDVTQQLRAFGGIELRPLPKSQILVDLGWSPEFCYQCTAGGSAPDVNKIRLRPTLSWGVRYEVADWMRLESGVRVPDIGEANLLDAQIFGQVTFTSRALQRAIEGLR
ncbi:MAG TPA: hypothetical protein VNO30_30915 [Kofleriaceae bacterium]|nr:hypothetical protein [Kofleriaceae bacterium]